MATIYQYHPPSDMIVESDYVKVSHISGRIYRLEKREKNDT